MSLDFGMQRIDEHGNMSAKHPRVLEDILEAVQAAFPLADGRYDVRKRGSKSLDVQLAAGSATVRADRAALNVRDLDEDADLKVIHAIAKAGDMVVITEDGSPILIDSKHADRLAPDWVDGEHRVRVARTWKELATLLRKAAGPALAYRDRVVASYGGESRETGGTPPIGDVGETAIYVQPRDGEREMQQLRRLFKSADRFIAERGGRRIEGTIGGLSWSLHVPTGERFIGCVVTGDVPDWMEFFKAYAFTERRSFGTIEGDATKFVIHDGPTFELSSCNLRRLTDED